MLQQCYLEEFSCCKKSFSVVAFKDGDKYILWTFAHFTRSISKLLCSDRVNYERNLNKLFFMQHIQDVEPKNMNRSAIKGQHLGR